MRFRVLSYNVLHSHGARRLLRGRAPGAWAHDRLQRVAELARASSPDVACFQEVDDAALAELERALGPEGLSCVARLVNEDLPPRDGCAVFVRRSRFEVVAAHRLRIRDGMPRHAPQSEAGRERLGLTSALWRELHEKLNPALAVRLRPVDERQRQEGREVCVATTHLYWDPRYPDLKLLQAFLLVRELDALESSVPLVLSGDLNSTPGLSPDDVVRETDFEWHSGQNLSGVYALLATGKVPPHHPHHPATLRAAPSGVLDGVRPDDLPELSLEPLRSSYLEAFGADGPVTNASRDFMGCLDYIFYRPRALDGCGRLRLLGAEALPAAELLQAARPLPSATHPSDHLPLVADFELGPSVEDAE